MPTAVMFEFSYDNGTTWHEHQNGQWTQVFDERRRLHPNHYYKNDRGANSIENVDFVYSVEVNPPMFGNAFRINVRCDAACSGRFDLKAQKLETFDPRTPQLALMDLGAVFILPPSEEVITYFDERGFNPLLSSNIGIHLDMYEPPWPFDEWQV